MSSEAADETRGTCPIFLSDVKARHDKMVELVTRMMELKKQQARALKKLAPASVSSSTRSSPSPTSKSTRWCTSCTD